LIKEFNPTRSVYFFNELISRKALSKRDVKDIEAGTIRTGMREHVAVCSWGPVIDVNRSGGIYGKSAQFVVDDFGPYFYSDNGLITSWQQ